ncbi:MAG: hypothetical protein AB7T49_11150 [Oligoflexales bacterium]
MMRIKQEQKNGITRIKIEGKVNEDMPDPNAMDIPTGLLEVDCEALASIDGVGVQKWMNFFRSVRGHGVKLKFTRCSPTLVRQASMLLSGFLPKEEVDSIGLPFFCESCCTTTVVCHKVFDLQEQSYEFQEPHCQTCGKPMEFDDLPELFFQFLK